MQQKREVLLKNRDELQRLSKQRETVEQQADTAKSSISAGGSSDPKSPDHDLKHSLDGLLSAIVEEVMQLNESVESLSSQLSVYQKGLSSLEVLRRQAHEEMICGLDLSGESSKLAIQLFDVFMETVQLHRTKVMALHRLEERRKKQRRRSSRVGLLFLRGFTGCQQGGLLAFSTCCFILLWELRFTLVLQCTGSCFFSLKTLLHISSFFV